MYAIILNHSVLKHPNIISILSVVLLICFLAFPILAAHCSLKLLIIAFGLYMESNYSLITLLQHTLASDENWDMSSLFMSPFYPQETRSYEQSHGDENV
jgi:hypothetical protein